MCDRKFVNHKYDLVCMNIYSKLLPSYDLQCICIILIPTECLVSTVTLSLITNIVLCGYSISSLIKLKFVLMTVAKQNS